MATWKDGMLILAGGAMGLMLAAILDSSKEDDAPEEKIDAMQLLVSKIRFEGEEALKSCNTDEEREKVFLQIENSVHEMQEDLMIFYMHLL